MYKYICECCGGHIDPHTMKCEYCGTQCEKHNENVYRIETFNSPVRTFESVYEIDDDMLSHCSSQDISRIVMNRLTDQLAQIITPYCEYETERDIRNFSYRVRARIKIVEPVNKEINVKDLRTI